MHHAATCRNSAATARQSGTFTLSQEHENAHVAISRAVKPAAKRSVLSAPPWQTHACAGAAARV